MKLAGWAAAVALLAAASARAAPTGDATRAEAAERFDRGLRLFNEGDNPGALAEFRRAYEIAPHVLVLFNIGLTYAAMNRPVEAADALDRVLASPGSLAPERVGHARLTRDEQARRVGLLQVVTSVPAVIEVNGLEAGKTPLGKPLRVAAGTHLVAAMAQGHLPARKEVTVAGRATAELRLDLAPAGSAIAHLAVRADVPDADILVDGQLMGRTPLAATLALPPGRRVVEARRAAYRTARAEVMLGEGAQGEVHLDLVEEPAAPSHATGRLALALSEPGAEITIDGRGRGPYRGSLRLPVGQHNLRVERPGFEPAERSVAVQSGRESTVRLTLRPTPETRLAHVEGVRARRRWGWVGLAAGGALAAAGSVLAVVSDGQVTNAERDLIRFGESLLDGRECDMANDFRLRDALRCDARLAEADQRATDASLRRTIGIAGAGVGLAAVGIGAYLLLGADDPHKYDRRESDLPVAVHVTGWPGGGAVAVVGRF